VVGSELGGSVGGAEDDAARRGEPTGGGHAARHPGGTDVVEQRRHVFGGEDPSREGLVDDVVGEQDGGRDLVADVLV